MYAYINLSSNKTMPNLTSLLYTLPDTLVSSVVVEQRVYAKGVRSLSALVIVVGPARWQINAVITVRVAGDRGREHRIVAKIFRFGARIAHHVNVTVTVQGVRTALRQIFPLEGHKVHCDTYKRKLNIYKIKIKIRKKVNLCPNVCKLLLRFRGNLQCVFQKSRHICWFLYI